jgi:hypothetical protein
MEFVKMKDLEQLIAGRQRDKKSSPSSSPEPKPKKESQPKDSKAEAIVKIDIKTIDRSLKIPIHEVIKVQNDSQEVAKKSNPDSKHTPNGGFINYKILVEGAKAGTLKQKKSSGHEALVSAYAEALVFKSFRDPRARDGVPAAIAVYEPVDRLKSGSLKTLIPNDGVRALATTALAKIGNKTPDLINIASTRSYRIGDQQFTYTPALGNVVDPANPNIVKETEIFKGTLISLVEVTRAKIFKDIEAKIDKFKAYGKTNSDVFHTVPVLVIDRGIYEGFSNDQKAKLLTKMNAVGGRIMLYKDLIIKSEKLADLTAEVLTQGVQSSKHRKSVSLDSDNTSEVATTNSTPTNSQTTLSMGETAEVSQANNAKLQEILARMQTRDRSETSNNILPTTSEIGSITTTPNTATVNTTDRDTAFLIPTSQNTTLTGGSSTTALTGWIGTTARTGGTSTTALTGSIGTTALTGGKTQEPSQLQQGMALS